MTPDQRTKIDAIKADRAELETPLARIAFDNDPGNGTTAERIVTMTEVGTPTLCTEHEAGACYDGCPDAYAYDPLAGIFEATS